MYNKYEGPQKTSVDTLNPPENHTPYEIDYLTIEEVAVEHKIPKDLEKQLRPSREVFKNYTTLPEMWEDYIPDNLEDFQGNATVEQIKETESFIKSIREYAEQSKSDILSIGYIDDGTFYITLTEGQNQSEVSVIRMNPLDGVETEEIIGQNVKLEENYDNQRHVRTAAARIEDELGNELSINLTSQGNSVTENGVTKSIRYAGNLDYELEHQFPMTPEGLDRKNKEKEQKRKEAENISFGGYR